VRLLSLLCRQRSAEHGPERIADRISPTDGVLELQPPSWRLVLHSFVDGGGVVWIVDGSLFWV
jgi:hypothetical protein